MTPAEKDEAKEAEAIAQLMEMDAKQIELVPHERVKWICCGKNCTRGQWVKDFGIFPMFYARKGVDIETKAKRNNWVNVSEVFHICPKHFELWKRLRQSHSAARVEAKILDLNKETYILNSKPKP